MSNEIRFSQIKEEIEPKPGFYEIWTDSGIRLKVGIGCNIRKRLLQHAASRQSGLKLKPNLCEKDRKNPNNVLSKSSILAKHLYYDKALGIDFNLNFTNEAERRKFLLEHCYIRFEIMETKNEARELELQQEQNEQIRYVGSVIIR